MSENKKKLIISTLIKLSATLSVIFFTLFIGSLIFGNSLIEVQGQNQQISAKDSQIFLNIEKLESAISNLDQLQKKIGTEKANDLVKTYNDYSNEFNAVALSVVQSELIKNNIPVKNKVIAANNKSIEFLNSIREFLSNPKNATKLDAQIYLNTYTELKTDIKKSTKSILNYNTPTLLFLGGLLGFTIFSTLTLILLFINVYRAQNDLFQIESQLSTFKSIINNMSEGVIVTNPYGFFTYYNQSALDIIGPNIHDIHYQSSIDLLGFHDNSGQKMIKTNLPFSTALQKNILADQEIYVKNSANPEGIYISASNGFYVNQRGETAGSVVVMKNITAKKQLEALWLKEKESAIDGSKKKSDFLASMSHEIRTPMNGIIGLTTLLNETPLNAEQKDYVGTVKRSAHSLLALINDILDHSKIEAGKVDLIAENFNLKLLIKDIIENFKFVCAEKNIEIVSNYPDELGDYFVADGNRLRQILMNLIGNAVKFTSVGKVELKLTFKKQQNSTSIQFEIIDTGAGMEPHEVERLFQRFFQTKSGLKFGGTGLGLSISKQLVDLMGGQIGVKSTVQVGSTFWFELSLKNGVVPASQDIQYSLSNLENMFSGKILVAEDNLVNQKVVSQYLKKMGFDVAIANNGQEAVTMFKTNPYDLIFMDCQMPIKNGYQATEEIIKLQSGQSKCIPIVALTAEGTSGEKTKCFSAGMNGFLNKPLVFEQLAALLNQYFPQQSKKSIEQSEIFKLSEIKVGDQLLLEVLLDDYKTSTPELIARMQTALKDCVLSELANAAHTLKSASATLSATKVSTICQNIETTATQTNIQTTQNEPPENLKKMVDELQYEYIRSIDSIQKTISEIQSQQKVSA